MPIETFNFAQTFYVEGAQVAHAPNIVISAIDLYFKTKPLPINNVSGIERPGVYVALVETLYGVPKLNESTPIFYAYNDYDNISASSDASIATTFRFNIPYVAQTNAEHAILIKFEGAAEYTLWTCIQGEYAIGTTQVSQGATNRAVGGYFSFINDTNSIGSNTSPSTEEFLNNWLPISDTDLKFKVYCARFSHNLSPVSANNTIPLEVTRHSFTPRGTYIDNVDGDFIIPTSKMEFITYDQAISTKEMFIGSQMAYQNTFHYPGGRYGNLSYLTVAVTEESNNIVATSTFPNGEPFNWNTIFTNATADKWFVICDTEAVNIRQVGSILSNTELTVTEPISFTNSTAEIMITPIGKIDSFNKGAPFGVSESFILLTNSSANATVRFVNNTIESTSLTDGGSGYSNSDILYVQGYEFVSGKVTGGYKAIANLVTNTSGGITNLYFSNAGAGFVNSDAIYTVISNSSSGNTTSNTSVGSGATFTYTVGATLKTEQRINNNFRNLKVMNIDLSEIVPFFDIISPVGTSYELKLQTKYERVTDANTYDGYSYYIDTSANANPFTLKMFQRNLMSYNKIPCYPSRSNEYNIHYSNGAINDQVSTSYSNSVQFIFTPVSNNDFCAAVVNSYPYAQFSKYVINNDYTNEHTDRGSAWAKHITRKIGFARRSEDIRVFLTTYRPDDTRIRVYARIYNNLDPEAFDDKEWTMLILKDGFNLVSSSQDTSDFIELAYGFPQYGNVEFICDGLATVSNNSANLIGIGTNWSTNTTSNLVSGDLIRIYQPLFDDDHIIAVVNAVANDSHLTINTPITNNNLLGAGLKIDKLEFPKQAFNNIMNDNVVRYYNSSLMEFDGYNNMQLKIVLMSSVPNKIPRIDDIRIVGVTA